MVRELLHRGGDLLGGGELLDQRVRWFLVDDARLLPFVITRNLDVAEGEDEGLLFAGRELDVEAMRGDGRPAAGDRLRRGALEGHVGRAPVVVEAEEGLAVGVEARDL